MKDALEGKKCKGEKGKSNNISWRTKKPACLYDVPYAGRQGRTNCQEHRTDMGEVERYNHQSLFANRRNRSLNNKFIWGI